MKSFMKWTPGLNSIVYLTDDLVLGFGLLFVDYCFYFFKFRIPLYSGDLKSELVRYSNGPKFSVAEWFLIQAMT